MTVFYENWKSFTATEFIVEHFWSVISFPSFLHLLYSLLCKLEYFSFLIFDFSKVGINTEKIPDNKVVLLIHFINEYFCLYYKHSLTNICLLLIQLIERSGKLKNKMVSKADRRTIELVMYINNHDYFHTPVEKYKTHYEAIRRAYQDEINMLVG